MGLSPVASPPARAALLLLLLLATLVRSAADDAAGLVRRAETEGAACSPEGQWNCMTDSWQRCAAGRWSSVVKCAPGTICTPSGLIADLGVEHGGGGAPGGNDGRTGGNGRGPVSLGRPARGSASAGLLALAVLSCLAALL
ncbi:hypothetical protein CDD83_9490 [Cordyceps sp. RAO-2017]|nr:hypothetical protein CDD83_9490 [Cordyceps sp. RAO-2017]